MDANRVSVMTRVAFDDILLFIIQFFFSHDRLVPVSSIS